MSFKILKCLLSFETKHHVIYLKDNDNSTDFITFNQFKENLINQYQDLIKELNLKFIDFDKLQFEIYDLDFQQFVIVDKWTQIKNLSKLKIINKLSINSIKKNSTNQIYNLNKNCFNNESIEINSVKNELNKDNNLNLSKNSNQSNYLTNSTTTLIKQNNSNQFDNTLIINNSNNLNKSNQLNSSTISINSNNQQENKSLNNSTIIETTIISNNHNEQNKLINSTPFNQLNKLRNSLTSFKVPNKLMNNSQKKSKSLNNSTNGTTISSSLSNNNNNEQQKNNSMNSLIAFSKSMNQNKKINKIDKIDNNNKLFKSIECQTIDNEKRIIHLKDNLFKEKCIKFKDDYYKMIEENTRLLAKLG